MKTWDVPFPPKTGSLSRLFVFVGSFTIPNVRLDLNIFITLLNKISKTNISFNPNKWTATKVNIRMKNGQVFALKLDICFARLVGLFIRVDSMF